MGEKIERAMLACVVGLLIVIVVTNLLAPRKYRWADSVEATTCELDGRTYLLFESGAVVEITDENLQELNEL